MINKYKGLDLERYLNKDITCPCGRTHHTKLKEIEISEGALCKVPELINKYGYKKVYLIADINTHKVAARELYDLLMKYNIDTKEYVFDDKELVPDEVALGKIIMDIDRDRDLIVAVGSGTINDLCKFVSFKLKTDFYVVATAPSMDGFASNVAPLINNNLKSTYENHVPKAIIGDLTILKMAPMKMIGAGVGDILGKYVCLLDWKIANLIQGEYHCSYIEDMIKGSIEAIVINSKRVKERDVDAIQAIMEGLVLSGIAMSFAGNSRPASGSEHHLSHYWEMMFLFQNKKAILHGTKVGIGTIVATELYNELIGSKVDFEKAVEKAYQFSIDDWEREIRKVYGNASKEIISFEKKVNKNQPDKVISRIGLLKDNWDTIIDLVKEYSPKEEKLIEILLGLDAPVKPEQVGIDEQMLEDSILYAKEIRNRYGLLQILFDLGIRKNTNK